MYEIVRVNDNVYYADCPSRVGIVRISDSEVFLIDTTSSKDAIKKIKKNIDLMGLTIKYVVNTHSHADHISGNKYLQDNFGVSIYGHGIDRIFINEPILESTFLYGAYPYLALRNHFLLAPKSICCEIPDEITDFSYVELAGHSFSDIIINCFNVWFIGDTIFSRDAVSKYHVPFIYNVKSYLESLEKLRNLDGDLFIPSHGPVIRDINQAVSFNIETINDISQIILDYCSDYHTYDDIFGYIFDVYEMENNCNQSVLVGSTIKAFLSYLVDNGNLEISFVDNRLCYFKVKDIAN